MVADTEFEFSFFGAEHDGLTVQAADHVEGRLGFSTQSELQEIGLNALLDGLAQLGLDLEEAIGGTQALDALIGALMVVMLDPEFDALAGVLEAVELGPHEEVLPDRGPEALDLAQRHRVLGSRLEVSDVILLELGLEAAHAPPVGVLATVVGEHLLGRLELAGGDAIDLDDRLRRGTAEQVRTDDEAGVIVHERDDVGVTATEAEREDVRLPHLIGRGPLEEAGPNHVAPFGRRSLRHEFRVVQTTAHRLRAGRQEEEPAQDLRDALDAEGGMCPLEFEDLLGDRPGQLGLAPAGIGRLQPCFAAEPIRLQPRAKAALADAHLRTDQRLGEPLLPMQPDGLELVIHCEPPARFLVGARPPRGALALLLCYCDYCLLFHVNTPSIIGVSTTFTLESVSRSGC